MCVRHTASFKNNYRGRPITKLFNTPRNIKEDDGETPVCTKQNLKKTAGTGWTWQFSVVRSIVRTGTSRGRNWRLLERFWNRHLW